jgi:sec-independent protein translocase protein TatA
LVTSKKYLTPKVKRQFLLKVNDMSLSMWQILLVVVLFILLFGRGRIPALMSDVAEGIRSFKKGMTEEQTAASPASAAPATDSAITTTTPHSTLPVTEQNEVSSAPQQPRQP